MEYKDYYAILGVPRDADDVTIKRAYRKLARQYHPDMNAGDAEAERMFKEINEAYTVLSDAEKRRRYDQFGAQWQQHRRTGREFDWSQWFGAQGQERRPRTVSPEEFEQMFGGSGSGSTFSDFFQQLFGGMGASRGPRAYTTQTGGRVRRAPGQTIPVEISLEEAFRGTTRTIQQGGSRFEVTIPAGVKTGSKVRARNPRGGGALGNLTLLITVKPHPNFVPEGPNLRTKIKIGLYTALLGGEVRIPTLEGALALVIPPNTQNGKVFRLKGQGMPKVNEPDERGDLLAEMTVELPVPLSPEEKRHFEALRRLKRTDDAVQ